MDTAYSVINIFDSLRSKYREYLKHEITSILMIQTDEDVILETTEEKTLKDDLIKQTTKRISLDFITEDDETGSLFFDPKSPLEKNARKFINEFTPYSIVNTTNLFHDQACDKISRKNNTFGIDA